MPAYPPIRLIILFVFLIQWHFVKAQPLSFTKFIQEDFVTTVFQDSHGFLWLGTPGGLKRFDGYYFKTFRYNETDSLSLSNDEIWNIDEDEAGYLWVGTNKGLNRLDPKRETFTRFKRDLTKPDGLTNDEIIDLLADTAGTVWVATANGLNRYLPKTNSFKRYLFHPNTVRPSRTPIQTRMGTIWVGVRDTLYRYEEKTDRFTGIPLPGNDKAANAIRLIYEDQAGYLWIGTQINGAFCFDPRRMTFLEHYKNEPGNPNTLSHNKVSAFIQNGHELWIGTTGGGLNVLNLETNRITRFVGTSPDPFGVNSETIRDAWEDNRGNIWLGTYYDGLYQFKSGQRIFHHFDQKSGLQAKKVYDIEETSDGKIWITMGTGGLAIFDPANNRFTGYYQYEPGNNNGLPPGRLRRLQKDRASQLWVASQSGGISRLDNASGLFKKELPKRPEDLSYLDFLMDFLIEENGDIWIARQEGLVKYVAATQSYKSYILPEKNDSTLNQGQNTYITSIYRDRQQQLWLTTNAGLNLYLPETDNLRVFSFSASNTKNSRRS